MAGPAALGLEAMTATPARSLASTDGSAIRRLVGAKLDDARRELDALASEILAETAAAAPAGQPGHKVGPCILSSAAREKLDAVLDAMRTSGYDFNAADAIEAVLSHVDPSEAGRAYVAGLESDQPAHATVHRSRSRALAGRGFGAQFLSTM